MVMKEFISSTISAGDAAMWCATHISPKEVGEVYFDRSESGKGWKVEIMTDGSWNTRVQIEDEVMMTWFLLQIQQ